MPELDDDGVVAGGGKLVFQNALQRPINANGIVAVGLSVKVRRFLPRAPIEQFA
jgi:hypothetical protein